jgi:predicted PurR-regulated permease PerM
MIVALLTKDSSSYILYVGLLYLVVQLIDNNYLVPKIVGSKVKLNALVSIVAVITGGALWGIPGMFLAIPLTAIIKLIFDSMPGMKPWAFLLGDTMLFAPKVKMALPTKKIKKEKKKAPSSV